MDSIEKLKFTTLNNGFHEDVQDFRRFAKHQGPMTYVLVSFREVPIEGFTDFKEEHLLNHHDSYDSEHSEEFLEDL